MKKILTILSLCIGVFLTAQPVIIPSANPTGTGFTNSPWRKPFGTNRSYERYAVKYTHAEINVIGQVTDLGFYVDSINTPGDAITKIYMKEVGDSTFPTATTVVAEEAGALLVYDDTIPAASFVKGQWTMVTLTTPFIHATTANIEIIIETNSVIGTDVPALAKGFRYSPIVGAARSEYWQSGSATSTVIPAGAGTLINGNRHNVQFVFAPIPPCIAPPTAGVANTNLDSICAGQSVSFTLSGSTSGTGLTYQWYSSTDSLNWAPISGATNPTYGSSIAISSYFMCVLTCSSQNDTSAGIYVYVRPFYECYCKTGLGGSCTAAIDSVAINGTTLNNGPSGCSPGFYISYPPAGNTTASLVQGQLYQFESRYLGNAKSSVWIDYNHNGIFDNSEWTQLCTTSIAGTPVLSNVTIPLSALTGLTGMRIRSRGNTGQNDSTSACASFASGEIEDYVIDITAALPCTAPPIAGSVTAMPDTICAGTAVNLTLNGYSSGAGTGFSWIQSTDGVNWNTAPGNSAAIVVSPSVTTQYACINTCSSQSDTSSIATVVVNTFYNCYCVTGLGGGCATNPGTTIDSVAIETTTLANGLTGCAPTFYTVYPASGNTSGTLALGQTYNIDVLMGGNGKCEMWIDYDHNGIFDPTEGTQVCLTSTAGVVNVKAFTIPMSALTGLTGMRIRTRTTGGTMDSTSACVATGSGETEDYLVDITTPTGINSVVSVNDFIAYPNPAKDLLTVQLSAKKAGKFTVQIQNITGEIILTEQFFTAVGTTNKAFDVSKHARGIYLVRLISETEVITKKVVLQ